METVVQPASATTKWATDPPCKFKHRHMSGICTRISITRGETLRLRKKLVVFENRKKSIAVPQYLLNGGCNGFVGIPKATCASTGNRRIGCIIGAAGKNKQEHAFAISKLFTFAACAAQVKESNMFVVI
jgi:hypothetical protein